MSLKWRNTSHVVRCWPVQMAPTSFNADQDCFRVRLQSLLTSNHRWLLKICIYLNWRIHHEQEVVINTSVNEQSSKKHQDLKSLHPLEVSNNKKKIVERFFKLGIFLIHLIMLPKTYLFPKTNKRGQLQKQILSHDSNEFKYQYCWFVIIKFFQE